MSDKMRLKEFFFGPSKYDQEVEKLERMFDEANRKLNTLIELDKKVKERCKSIEEKLKELDDSTKKLSDRANASLAKLAELRERYGSSSDTMPPLDAGALKVRAAREACLRHVKLGDQASKDTCDALMRELKASVDAEGVREARCRS